MEGAKSLTAGVCRCTTVMEEVYDESPVSGAIRPEILGDPGYGWRFSHATMASQPIARTPGAFRRRNRADQLGKIAPSKNCDWIELFEPPWEIIDQLEIKKVRMSVGRRDI
nr:factor of DNA methylation 4-like [Ipomoea batatas]